MSGIVVSVKPPTSAGRLYPRYDKETGILAVESDIERTWPFGVDVDGRLVFDLDEERILANFDLHITKDRWERNLDEDAPLTALPGDLQFDHQTIIQKSFHLALRVRSDQAARRLRIDLGTTKPDRAIALSDSCIALLADRQLAGFFIKEVR